MQVINKDTRLCMSLAARPGNFGTRFHNFLYRELGLNYVYKAFTTRDLPAAIAALRALEIRGCAVSMPFKEASIPLVDELDASAAAIDSINTIVNDDGTLKAYNTDYVAARKLIEQYALPRDALVALRGSGGMAKAVAAAFRDAGFSAGHIVARNAVSGRALAQRCGYGWGEDVPDDAKILVNVTPVGMAGGTEAGQLAFAPEAIARASVVFDVVAMPAETPLILAARAAGKPVITGLEVLAIQGLEQFVLYTGVRPSEADMVRALAYAREVMSTAATCNGSDIVCR